MPALRIALVQMRCPKGGIAQNLAEISWRIRHAVARDVNIICFPEMSITGYIDPARSPESVLTRQRRGASVLRHDRRLIAATPDWAEGVLYAQVDI